MQIQLAIVEVLVGDFQLILLLPLSAALHDYVCKRTRKETSKGEINGLNRGNVYYEAVDLHVDRNITHRKQQDINFWSVFPLDGCSPI